MGKKNEWDELLALGALLPPEPENIPAWVTDPDSVVITTTAKEIRKALKKGK